VVRREGGPGVKAYLIFATPRSGSYLLCEHLTATGRAGRPDEYLSRRWRAHAAGRGIDPLADVHGYLRMVVDDFAGANSVFGLKLMWQHFVDLSDGLRAGRPPGGDDADLVDVLTGWCGDVRLVWIRRRDKLAQALSYWRAIQTGSWSCYAEPGSRPADERYDYGAIRELGRELVEEEGRIRGYLDARGLAVHEVWYEDLVAEPAGTTRAVLEHLGEAWPDALTFPVRRLVRQADALTETWRRAFLADLAAELSSAELSPAGAGAPGKPGALRPTPG